MYWKLLEPSLDLLNIYFDLLCSKELKNQIKRRPVHQNLNQNGYFPPYLPKIPLQRSHTLENKNLPYICYFQNNLQVILRQESHFLEQNSGHYRYYCLSNRCVTLMNEFLLYLQH